jgi:hypothetical protein
MKQFTKDLPVYINGFVITKLFIATPMSTSDIVMVILAGITFFWYGYNEKQEL